MILVRLFTIIISCAWSQSPTTIATIAKVGDQVITTRDLQINQFLNEFENPLGPFFEKKDPLREMTWEFLIFKESQGVLNQGISDGEIQAYLKPFKKSIEKDQLWKSLQVGDKALIENVRRKLTVKKLINIKMPEQLIQVDDDSIESYYTLNKAQLGNRPLEDVREKIIKGLKEKKMQERFQDWMAAITRAHGVVYFSGVKIQ
jgi:hypothetical protein